METRGLREGQDGASIGPLYIIYFAATHENFRLAEFQAAADYLDISYAFVPVPVNRMPRLQGDEIVSTWRDAMDMTMDTEEAERGINVQRPFMLIHLASDDIAKRLCERVTSIKSIWQQWASATTFEYIQLSLQGDPLKERLGPYFQQDVSWRAHILSHQRHLNNEDQIDRINRFEKILPLLGPIKMKGADLEWGYLEEWTTPSIVPEEEEANLDMCQFRNEVRQGKLGNHRQKQRLLSMHVGRKVSDGVARDLIVKMDVKQRKYIGNTTMEAQMSLIQALMAKAGPGKIVYDPFAGTCSILLAAAALGADVFASDIDGRMMRGKGDRIAVLESAKQYGVEDRFLGFVCSDISQHPWRGSALFDAIVADPPYGVRAGAKQLGRRDVEKQRTEPFLLPNGIYSHEQPDYIPPTKPYALDHLLLDLMNFSAKVLAPKGRLVFWMPTMIESSSNKSHELQLELTRDFRLVAHSLQDFGVWGRRLITLEKVDSADRSSEVSAPAVLPSPPMKHLQSTTSERMRATDDPNEFRNKVSYSRRPLCSSDSLTAWTSSSTLPAIGTDTAHH
jgi:tRNA (guanine10-N2)-methyltransferase